MGDRLSNSLMNFKRIAVGAGVLLILVLIVLLPRQVLEPRTVARIVTPDGYELRMVQQTDLNSLPWFTTSFLVRKPDGSWERYQVDHEDHYWSAGRVALDTNAQAAMFHRGTSLVVRFAWRTGAYTNLQRPFGSGEPDVMPPGWSPGENVFTP